MYNHDVELGYQCPGSADKPAGRTLFLLNSLNVGGSERKIINLVNALKGRGREVRIAYLNPPEGLKPLVAEDVPLLALDRRGKFSILAMMRLRRYLDQVAIERIVTVNLHPLIYAFPASLATARRPEIIALVNTTDFRSARDARFMLLYAPLLRRADCVVFGSNGQRRFWSQRYRLNARNCFCVFNGIDTEYFRPATESQNPRSEELRGRLGIPVQLPLVGCVATMRPEKSLEDLLVAVSHLRNNGLPMAVLLVGDGPCRARLERLAGDLGIAELTLFPGSTADVRPLLQAMDIFVLPSTAVETFSNAALEAMAMEKPVVLSDVGGAREMLVHNVSGLIYQAGNTPELAKCLQRLASDASCRERLGRQARERVSERFSFERMVRSYEHLLDRA